MQRRASFASLRTDDVRQRLRPEVAASLRVAAASRRSPASGAAAALRLLDDALRRIACVAAPCIRPADAGNAARVGVSNTTTLLFETASIHCHSERRPPLGGRSRRISLGLPSGTEAGFLPKARPEERFFAPPALSVNRAGSAQNDTLLWLICCADKHLAPLSEGKVAL